MPPRYKLLFSRIFQMRNVVRKMKRLFTPILISFFLVFNTVICAGGEWYQNGNLHHSNVAEWNKATYANKLATAADMVLVSTKIKNLVKESGDVDTARPFAVELVTCLNEAAAGEGYEDTDVATLAVMCMKLMGWLEDQE
jgi:hypothetical protein